MKSDNDTDLFGEEKNGGALKTAPLARRMRPTSIDEFVGQDHLLQEGSLLRRMIESDRFTSIILYGPPGTGKTSLAHIIAETTKSCFERVNAVSSGVSEIRQVVGRAKMRLHQTGQKTMLFIDEIHRFNKAQQEVLLPDVEDGHIILIGTTVENPFFYIVSPLISRSHVFELRVLSKEALKKLLQRALTDTKNGLGALHIEIEEEAVQCWIDHAEGDARRFLNTLEVAVFSTTACEDKIVITRTRAEESVPGRVFRHDRNGDSHYDIVSAFIKSMRGSDPDAALYWMARMITAGEDPRYIARRIIICASEDVGNADPQALGVASAAFTAAQYLGMPEAQIPLAQAAVYVATAPKSNACSSAISLALEDIREGQMMDVPVHLKDAQYPGAKQLDRGQGYLYPHSYEHGYIKQEYLPKQRKYYTPSDRGYERIIKRHLEKLRNLSEANLRE
ncbi:MAG: replication-associated recombination protein A [Gemmatimonadota bacterium]|nr:MAG: replication-associated recombination protein A [Gemmatimonadota bacterium]